MQTATRSEREAGGQLNIASAWLLTGELAEERTRNICIQTSPGKTVEGVQERAAKLKSTRFIKLELFVQADILSEQGQIAYIRQIGSNGAQVLHHVLTSGENRRIGEGRTVQVRGAS